MGIVNRYDRTIDRLIDRDLPVVQTISIELDGTSDTFEYNHGLGRVVVVVFRNHEGDEQTISVEHSEDLNSIRVTSVVLLYGTLLIM